MILRWIFGKKKNRFQPLLIDLVEYEKTLLYAREHGKSPVPVTPISVPASWTEGEIQCMRDNREQARLIHERIFPIIPLDTSDDHLLIAYGEVSDVLRGILRHDEKYWDGNYIRWGAVEQDLHIIVMRTLKATNDHKL